MIRLQLPVLDSLADIQAAVQTAIEIEFSTLPPYLYAASSILPGTNAPAVACLREIIHEEMIHLCLASNIMNAIGGSPQMTVPKFPGPLPGDVGRNPDGTQFSVHLYPFSPESMKQGMNIEEPDEPIDPPEMEKLMAMAIASETGSIADYYRHLENALSQLPASAWQPGRNQIDDSQFFQGQLFAVNSFADAQKAISDIVSEGEGSSDSPLNFEGEVSHFYRFQEIYRNQVLTKANNAVGYVWGLPLGIDYAAAYPAITDPCIHDFSHEPAAAQAAQVRCNSAFSDMVDALQLAFNGQPAQLGVGVRSMFALRQAMQAALTTPLADGHSVAGPSFLYIPQNQRQS
ncbi:ferritin-like domain-containing protein [Brevifollis gellanilyticus]|uniref:Iminophenyl-pyruvate dimer synthase domain-containing protein n=1 Tax=Brevifollis gellanilyticus TaxID=748831 RepID=A0A512MEC5_9BACT|nr:ferritin-like protein [Brevifollis gellanilyticus]GEP45095.1 hypothetical protein BGE01nite_43860 [Brevifollis gellanilyticus]